MTAICGWKNDDRVKDEALIFESSDSDIGEMEAQLRRKEARRRADSTW